MQVERVVLLMVDVDKTGHPVHAVVYDQDQGQLQAILGSYEAGPFDTHLDFARWFSRVLRLGQVHAR